MRKPCANNTTHSDRLSDLARTRGGMRKKNSLGPPVDALRTRPGYQNKFFWRNLNLVRDEGRMSSEALFEQVLT